MVALVIILEILTLLIVAQILFIAASIIARLLYAAMGLGLLYLMITQLFG